MLKGTNILISEDFPKDVMEKRSHLIKFAKEVITLLGVVFKLIAEASNKHIRHKGLFD